MRFLPSAFLLSLFCFHPLFANNQSNIEISTDYFTGITLDKPVSGPFFSSTPIRFSGTVSDPSVSEVRFIVYFNQAEDIGSCDTFNYYSVLVHDRKFSYTLFFSNEQAGNYHLQLLTKRGRQPYTSAGVVRSILILENTKTTPIPTGFFPDIELTSPFPVNITSGQAVRVSGAVFDPSLTMVALSFFQKNVDFRLIHRAPVIDGQFKKTIFFAHKTAGVYQLELWRYQGHRQSAAPQDVFRPINVLKGAGTAYLPYDYFEEVIITSRMPVVFTPGQKLRITGAVSDPSVSDIEFRFWMPDGHSERSRGTTDVNFKAAISFRQFTIMIDFPSQQQPGDYRLDVFLHRRDNRSQGPRTFRPITILPSADFDGNGTVDLADFRALAGAFGRSSADHTFDPRYDLDGDGEVGFSDFLIFARAFGL